VSTRSIYVLIVILECPEFVYNLKRILLPVKQYIDNKYG